MACKPQYKGVRYNSVEELIADNDPKAVQKRNYKLLQDRIQDPDFQRKAIEEYNNLELQNDGSLEDFIKYKAKKNIGILSNKNVNDISESISIDNKVKLGVSELFESNPELANTIYETLGFKTDGLQTFKDKLIGIIGVDKVKELYAGTDVEFDSFIIDEVELGTDKDLIITIKTDKGQRTAINLRLDGDYQQLKISEGNKVVKGIYAPLSEKKTAIDFLISEFKNLDNQEITPQQKQQAQQQYSQYLDTIFPDSKVKDIVYHGTTKGKFDKFITEGSLDNIGKLGAMAGSIEAADLQRGKQNKPDWVRPEEWVEPELPKDSHLYSLLFNLKNPYIADSLDAAMILSRNDLKEKGYDGVIIRGFENDKGRLIETGFGDEYVVFESEQIHILGSKQDIKQFKSWADGFNRNNQKLNSDSLFGLNTQNQEQLEFHVNTLNVVSQFLENIGVEQRLVTDFLSPDGNVVEGAIAAANFIEGTVDIIDDLEKGRAEAWNKLPEEAAHWWYRLLDTNSPLKKALWESHQTALKNDELYAGQYGKLVKSPSDLTEESIGQLITEAIKRIEIKNASASDYSFFKKFLEWINSIINVFKNTTQDPFEVAAMKILSSDMSDLMTWEEYRKLNNIVNFADVLTEQSIIDYSQYENVFITETEDGIKLYGVHDSPLFDNEKELKLWIEDNNNRIQEVRDNQVFFDRLLNKTFRKKSKFLPKTLRKYYDIIDTQNLNPLREWNISQELQQITKKLSDFEKQQIIETNGYTNIAPTLKILPNLLQKYRKNPIVLSEAIKIDGAKKQELSILNGIREMIKLENPNLKSITAEEFVNEAHNWLQTNYLLGFANEQSYLSYKIDQTFSYISDRQFDEHVDITNNMTEEELQRLLFEQRQRIANIIELTKQNPYVYHNKVSLRFNDSYHEEYGQDANHFAKRPSAWGNLTYFYTGKNKWKDAVLLHEIQNDNIEALRNFKAEKVDLETSLGRYLQQLNTDLFDNITQIESGGKKIIRRIVDNNAFPNYRKLTTFLYYNKDLPLEQGLQRLKEILNELIELYRSDSSKDINKAQEAVDEAYSQRRKFQEFQKRGGIKSLLTQQELNDLKDFLQYLNNTALSDPTNPRFGYNQFDRDTDFDTLKEKKRAFTSRTGEISTKINSKLKELYGDNAPVITLRAPAKPLPKSQRRIGNFSQELNENVNFLIAFSEKQIITQLSKNIEESKKSYIFARNGIVANNFNVALSKITPEQYAILIENYKYNEDLLNRLIDEQAQKDVKQSDNLQLQKENALQKIKQNVLGFWGIPGEYHANGTPWVFNTKEQAEKHYNELYDINTQKKRQKNTFETLKQKALDKKAELEKNYGKIEEEVKQTLEIEMNYFTPLVHHLIQKHINQYGKDFPMYFSGYNITKLTQGNDRTAMIYAGKDEINTVDKSNFTLDKNRYEFTEGSESWQKNYYKGSIDSLPENDENIDEKEYEKAYQQATERRAKEIKFEAAKQIGFLSNEYNGTNLSNLTDKQLEEGIKELNEYKRQSKQNMDRVINTIMNISNSKPIETGAIYNAMSQISGIKLIWQDKIDGLKGNEGGYLVDLSEYNYNVPVLYQKQIDLQAEQDAVLEEFANSLSERFNISFDLISEKEAKSISPKYTNEPAFFDPKTKKAYLVKGKANKTSAIHEIFTHPFLLQIEKTNPTLYKNLLKEAKNNKSVVDYVDNLYGTNQNNAHEYIARAIDLAVQGELDQQKDKTLLERIQDFFNQLSDYLKKLFNIPKVFSSAISPNITLQQLTQFAMYGKGKMNLNPAQENIEYSLKATNIIVKNLDKIKQWEKNKSISEDVLWNKIQELGVSKEQLELIKNSEGNTVEEKLLEFANEYSYAVEINTATKERQVKAAKDDETVIRRNGRAFRNLGDNADYHSKLTVPGGTNYTENAIQTPNIINISIAHIREFAKGIANMLGWFRSDERGVSTKPIDDGSGLEPTGNFIGSKTRRILEVQSDLFQKGRDKNSLIKGLDNENKDFIVEFIKDGLYLLYLNQEDYKNGINYTSFNNRQEAIRKGEELSNTRHNKLAEKNSFLQLLNKDNNWVTFFIKSVIQDSAKKGYEKVLFPTGTTASKVEGHTTLEEFKKQREDRIKELENENNAYKNVNKIGDKFSLKYKYPESIDKTVNSESQLNDILDIVKNNIKKINQLKQQLERVETEEFGALKPIYKFYSIDVRNTLVKQYGEWINTEVLKNKYGKEWKEKDLTWQELQDHVKSDILKFIIDEYDNTWNEVTIDENRDNQNIVFQKTPQPNSFSQYQLPQGREIEEFESFKNSLDNELSNPELLEDTEIQDSELTYTDEEGKNCAAFGGKTSFTKGKQWKIVKDLGRPSFSKGYEWKLYE